MSKSKSILVGRCVLLACGLLILLFSTTIAEKPNLDAPIPAPTVFDNGSFIDANEILMMVTNYGIFARDLFGVFGRDYGTYYPFIDDSYILNGQLTTSPLYGAGCWIGGIDEATGHTLVTVAEYSSEFIPGPMENGTYLPDNEYFRVYKLYRDSSKVHPNQDYQDYLNYAIPNMGAPVDHRDNPLLLGDQTLWAVFNDAYPDAHNNNAGETEPLGIEVQQTVWACDDPGSSPVFNTDNVLYDTELPVTQVGESIYNVKAYVADPTAVTGNQYRVVFEAVETLEGVTVYWHLENVTTATRLLSFQSIGEVGEVVEGLAVGVTESLAANIFSSFEVVANADGPIDPPEAGAAAWAGFPVPVDEFGDPLIPTENQQATGDGRWLFHTGDNGGTSGGGDRGDFGSFTARVTREDPARIEQIVGNDFEMRFTGSPDNPGEEGSWIWEWATDGSSYWVPFELWRIGATPDDPSDDVRLLPYIFGDGDSEWNMSSYGSDLLANCGPGGCEHSVDDGDDDPYTDWVYWRLPSDDSPGEAGYLAFEAEMQSDPTSRIDDAAPIMGRTVLVNWDGGIQPPFTQACPEQGTIFRISGQPMEPAVSEDTFLFVSSVPPSVLTGSGGQSIYISYKLYNEGGKTLSDCYFSLWSDPDLGTNNDDLVGCDTLTDICFTYNGNDSDGQYGYTIPAVGFKYIYGPMEPSPGDSAYFAGNWIHGYRNLGMTAFTKYINGTDPDNFMETYGYMQGLTKSGDPYEYNGDVLTYARSGDPVTGEGDVDYNPDDVRMFATCGPFDFNPGDSQYVLIKMAVAQGTDRLNSITRLREILNLPFELKLPGPSSKLTTVPEKFEVAQNYPNPFNPTTTIQYGITEQAHVTVDVFNVLGQKVRRLVNKTQAPGVYNIEWNSTDESGNEVASGIYFYRVQAGEHSAKKTMVLVK